MAVASTLQAKQLRRISEQDGGITYAETRVLAFREKGTGPKAIARKTGYPEWFINRVLNVV